MKTMKKCRTCGIEKNLEKEFYKHSEMLDGYLNICKTCIKQNVRNRYSKDLTLSREKEHERYLRRKENPDFIKKSRESCKKYKSHPMRKKWTNCLYEKLLLLRPNKCEVCHKVVGEFNGKIHAHHKDYRKLKDIVWCCPACHVNFHRKVA